LGDVQLKEFEVTAQVKMEESVFIRRFKINSYGKSLMLCQKEVGDVSCDVWDAVLYGKSLMLCQKEVGDVSCDVWDAVLILAKYLEARCNDMQDWLQG